MLRIEGAVRAHIKINISIQFDGGADDQDEFPLAQHHAGLVAVADVAEGKRVMEMLSNHVNQTFTQMGVTVVSGDHKPDLKLAHGGSPEDPMGVQCQCGHMRKDHSVDKELHGCIICTCTKFAASTEFS